MKTISHILDRKGHDVWQVAPGDSVYEALRTMAEHDVGALIVMDDGVLAGIISERDYARKVILEDRRSQDVTVGEIMTSPVTTVGPDQHVEECMALMTEHRIRHLPVVEEGSLVGVISIGDVVEAVIGDLTTLVDQLERYVRGV